MSKSKPLPYLSHFLPEEHDDSRCSVADGDLGDLGDQDLWEDQSERGVENLDAEPSPTNEKAQYGDRRDRGVSKCVWMTDGVTIARYVLTPVKCPCTKHSMHSCSTTWLKNAHQPVEILLLIKRRVLQVTSLPLFAPT